MGQTQHRYSYYIASHISPSVVTLFIKELSYRQALSCRRLVTASETPPEASSPDRNVSMHFFFALYPPPPPPSVFVLVCFILVALLGRNSSLRIARSHDAETMPAAFAYKPVTCYLPTASANARGSKGPTMLRVNPQPGPLYSS